jgi:hypothetical protein
MKWRSREPSAMKTSPASSRRSLLAWRIWRNAGRSPKRFPAAIWKPVAGPEDAPSKGRPPCAKPTPSASDSAAISSACTGNPTPGASSRLNPVGADLRVTVVNDL